MGAGINGNGTNENFIFQFIADTEKKKKFIYRETVLVKVINKILNTLKKEPDAYIFLTKVTEKLAPNYFTYIKHPMDLGTISKKIYLYKNIGEFKADLNLIWENCFLYNKNAPYYVNCAVHCRDIANRLLDDKGRVPAIVPESVKITSDPIYTMDDSAYFIVKYFKEAGFKRLSKKNILTIIDLLEDVVSKVIKENNK